MGHQFRQILPIYVDPLHSTYRKLASTETYMWGTWLFFGKFFIIDVSWLASRVVVSIIEGTEHWIFTLLTLVLFCKQTLNSPMVALLVCYLTWSAISLFFLLKCLMMLMCLLMANVGLLPRLCIFTFSYNFCGWLFCSWDEIVLTALWILVDGPYLFPEHRILERYYPSCGSNA